MGAEIGLVIFDFDGTLANSEPGITWVIEQVIAELDLPPTAVETWRQMIGIPLRTQLTHLLPETRQAELENWIERYRAISAEVEPHFAPFEGMQAVVEHLDQAGIPMAIASSRVSTGILKILAHWDWPVTFDPVISPTEVRQPKPHPESVERILAHYDQDPATALLIGDTSFDIEMACRAGISSWGVTWGVHSVQQLQTAGATRCFTTPADVLKGLQG
ncbi:MAG: HAD family hydrolase [Cyanophyceae cyanobacterium]